MIQIIIVINVLNLLSCHFKVEITFLHHIMELHNTMDRDDETRF